MFTGVCLALTVGCAIVFVGMVGYARFRRCRPRLITAIGLAGCACCYISAGVIEEPRIEIAGWLWGPAQLSICALMLVICLPYVAAGLRSLRQTGRPSLFASDMAAAPRLKAPADDSTLTLLAPVMRAYAGVESVAWQYLPDDRVALTLVNDGVAVVFTHDAISVSAMSAGGSRSAEEPPQAGRPMRRA